MFRLLPRRARRLPVWLTLTRPLDVATCSDQQLDDASQVTYVALTTAVAVQKYSPRKRYASTSPDGAFARVLVRVADLDALRALVAELEPRLQRFGELTSEVIVAGSSSLKPYGQP